jgi:hypothetical protein
MFTRFILGLSVILAAAVSARADESPHEKVVRIISLTPPIYVPTDDSAEEQKRATAINSTLRNFLLSDSTPEEVRVCYALEILAQRLVTATPESFPKAYREDIMQDHKALTLYLRELNEQKR